MIRRLTIHNSLDCWIANPQSLELADEPVAIQMVRKMVQSSTIQRVHHRKIKVDGYQCYLSRINLLQKKLLFLRRINLLQKKLLFLRRINLLQKKLLFLQTKEKVVENRTTHHHLLCEEGRWRLCFVN